MDTNELLHRLADGQDRILRAVAQLEVQVTSVLSEQCDQKRRVGELEADSHRMQGAWRLLKLGGAITCGGVAVVGGVLKLFGKL